MANLTNWTEAVGCLSTVTEHMHSTWIYTVFGECVYNLRQYFAFFFGMLSIVFWIFAQVPQLITNCRSGKADKALSFWFILLWTAGDTTNLIGSILTQQLATQITTAVYFVLIDVVTMVQLLYYVVRNQGFKGLLNCCKCPSKKELVAVFLPGMMCTLLLGSGPFLWRTSYSTEPRVGRVLLQDEPTTGYKPVVNVHDPLLFIGYLLGCVSGLLYVGSRVPQILKNFTRCSVDGLSLPMFILAVLGNIMYALGIFLYSVDGVFLLKALPWIVGSVGTLFFDLTLLFQFVIIQYYGSTCSRKRSRKEEEDEKPLLESARDSGSIEMRNIVQNDSHTQTSDKILHTDNNQD